MILILVYDAQHAYFVRNVRPSFRMKSHIDEIMTDN